MAGENGGRWKFRHQIGGRRREMGLGSFPAMSLAEARRERDKWAAVKESGQDPIRERDRQRAEDMKPDRGDPTFEEMAHIAFEARKEMLRGDGERGRWFAPLRLHVIPKIGAIPVSSLTQRDIRDALQPIWRTKTRPP
ncbi:integrase arm-type DNA-binding domain-containing protein [Jhaorihella thermophila]